MEPAIDYPIIDEPRVIALNIKALMLDRGIRSTAALQKMLAEEGLQISSAQLVRIVNNRATRLNMTVMNGLMRVLRCSARDLFREQKLKSASDRRP